MTHSGRIGVFGGTFDPIHLGHLSAAQDAGYSLSLERILFVPSRQPPHKQHRKVAPVEDRVAMVRLAVEENPLFEVSTIELDRSGPSYSLDTLRQLAATLGPVELYFMVGRDALPELHTWHEPDALLKEFRIVVLDRPTWSAVDWSKIVERFPDIRQQVQVLHIVQLEISSSDIRRRVADGRPIRYYVVPPVERYIQERGLYR